MVDAVEALGNVCSKKIFRLEADGLKDRTSIASWTGRPGRNPQLFGSKRASHSGSRASLAKACSARSRMAGIPKGRISAFPSLGIHTRRTGRTFCRNLGFITVGDCPTDCNKALSEDGEPDQELSDIVIRYNEILVGKRRFVLKLAEHTQGNIISNVTPG